MFANVILLNYKKLSIKVNMLREANHILRDDRPNLEAIGLNLYVTHVRNAPYT